MKIQFGLNDKVTFFPNQRGFVKMAEIYADQHKLNFNEAWEAIDVKTTSDGGYKDQLWSIMEMFAQLFTMGTNYLKNTHVELEGAPK